MIDIVVDTREKIILYFPPHLAKIHIKKLNFGDYSIQGYETQISVERKSLNDLVSTITRTDNWERFLREMKRFDEVGCQKIIVAECSYSEICKQSYNSQVNPEFVNMRLAELSLTGVQIYFTETPGLTSYFVFHLFRKFLKENDPCKKLS